MPKSPLEATYTRGKPLLLNAHLLNARLRLWFVKLQQLHFWLMPLMIGGFELLGAALLVSAFWARRSVRQSHETLLERL